MKKYRKPMLDIIEFENMDVIVMSGGNGNDEDNDETNVLINSVNSGDRLSEEPTHESDENAEIEGTTHESDENAEIEGTTQGSEESTDDPVLSEETLAPQGTESDTDEPDTQSESQSDDDGLS